MVPGAMRRLFAQQLRKRAGCGGGGGGCGIGSGSGSGGMWSWDAPMQLPRRPLSQRCRDRRSIVSSSKCFFRRPDAATAMLGNASAFIPLGLRAGAQVGLGLVQRRVQAALPARRQIRQMASSGGPSSRSTLDPAPATASTTPAPPASSAPTSASFSSASSAPASVSSSPASASSSPPPPPSASPSYLDRHGFERSEKADKATHVNLRARLSRESSKNGGGGSLAEVWRLLRIARPELRWLAVAFVLLLFSSGVSMSIPFSVGRLLDLASKGATDEDVRVLGLTLPQFFMAFGAVLTVGALSTFLRIVILRTVGERVVARLRSQLYRHTFTQDAEFFDANRVGDLISRLSSDTVVVGKSITQNLSDGMRAVVSGSAGLVAMLWLSPSLTSILLVMFPPLAVGAVVYGRVIRTVARRIQRNLGTLTKIAEERLGNVKTSQAFAGEVREVARYHHQVRKIFALGRREALVSATYFGANGWFGNMTILALLVVGGNLVRSGSMSVGDLTSFMMYTAFAGSSLFGVSGFYSELMKGVGAATRLFELLDREPAIHATVGRPVASAQGPIRFEGVAFAYPTRPAVTIFENLTFEIPSGSNVCIVGPSGGGKSTVASLLLRFYAPTRGRITINDGVDIATLNAKSLRRRIGMVSQEPVLFSGTIADNIAYGCPGGASREAIVAAAQKANCQFLRDFPDGLDTPVGPRGAQLSGGQKQRIAIARALIKDPDILILDEATSALDAESETLVNAALAELLKGRSTTISIAHRLSTIQRSDQIIVLNNRGSVAETGRYADLSADKNSAFSRLMEWQMSGGEPPVTAVDSHITEKEEMEEDLENAAEEDDDDEENGKQERNK